MCKGYCNIIYRVFLVIKWKMELIPDNKTDLRH